MSGHKRNIPGLTRSGSGAAGFTIIELMVALAIGALVMAGMVQMFKSNREAFTLLDEVKNMETNARVAIDFLSRDARIISAPAGSDPMIPYDNMSPSYSPVQTALGAKEGTDIIEIFTSTCPEAIYVPQFNENSAALPQVSQLALVGCMDCYDLTLSAGELSDCVQQYNVNVVDVDPGSSPTGYSCQNHMTNANWQGSDRINLNWNRGANNDNANRPHQCNNPNNASQRWDASFTIGSDVYYYVRESAAGEDNPQLIRYRVGGPEEVIANYVEDFQITYGEDTDSDGLVDVWVDGYAITDIRDVTMIRFSVRLKTTRIDPNKTATVAPILENSTVSSTVDRYRRRVLTRTVRLRNMGA